MTRVLLTGASGFVGSAVQDALLKEDTYEVITPLRNLNSTSSSLAKMIKIDSIDGSTNWSSCLKDVDIVIHTAARVHIMNDKSENPLAEFRKMNVEATLNLARQAAIVGVKRFIFLSSIKVNGEHTELNKPFKADDKPEPKDPYGISKMEAENMLLALAADTDMEIVIIRPVLIYGPNVKANFLSMMKWLSKGMPLPLGAIHNKRSLVALDNLVSLIITCMHHPSAANQIFLVSDGDDLSTPDLLRKMSVALKKNAILLPIPVTLIKVIATLLGRPSIAQRLCSSLQVDITKTRHLLDWTPVISVDNALFKTAINFNKSN